MSTPIILPPELESALAVRASAMGMKIEELAVRTLERFAHLPPIDEIFADVQMEFRASGMTDEELSEEIQQALKEVRETR